MVFAAPRSHILAVAVAAGIGLLVVFPGRVAAQDASYTITLKEHRFVPDVIEIPADKKVALVVKNLDPTPEEFESPQLRREKVVPGGQEITIYLGPLQPGRYEFFGEFNPKTARGHIVVK